MSARSRRGDSGVESTGQDFDLNLAPIIDCFTIIIVFLLTSASFVSIGVLDVNMSSPLEDTAAASATESSPPEVTLRLRDAGWITIEVKPVSGPTQSLDFPPESGNPAIAAVTAHLQKIKAESPSLVGATILAMDGVRYKDLVHTVESVRDVLPGVSIGNLPVEAK
jgi:biopolymer transport protein ExbD